MSPEGNHIMSRSPQAAQRLGGQPDMPVRAAAWLSFACSALALPICFLPVAAMLAPEATPTVLHYTPPLMAGGMLALLGVPVERK
jgi:hypothetical protein